MRIALFVGVLVMHAMRGYPGDRSALESEGAASGEKILHPFGRFISTMSQQAMVAHAYAQAAANPPHDNSDDKGLPGEEKHGGERAKMQADHHQSDAPI